MKALKLLPDSLSIVAEAEDCVFVRRNNSTAEFTIDDESEANFHNTDTSNETNDSVTDNATNANGSE